ncbi:hypothetical protein D1007_61813 [Hordeum vulgare]|nr:hypothetical protein D1007_61813 [Hordeum vulgare]
MGDGGRETVNKGRRRSVGRVDGGDEGVADTAVESSREGDGVGRCRGAGSAEIKGNRWRSRGAGRARRCRGGWCGWDGCKRTNQQTNNSVINWEEYHIMWVDMWNAQRNARFETDQTSDTDEATCLRHLEWMHKEYRVIHKGAWTRSDCLDLPPSEAADVAFNNSIMETVGAHLDYGPLHDRVGTELWRCINDSNVMLGRAPAGLETNGLARTTLQKVANRCRTLAALLSCHGVSSTDVRARC